MNNVDRLKQIALRASELNEADEPINKNEKLHAFAENEIHDSFPDNIRILFDNGHFSQAIFEAAKFLEHQIITISGLTISGQPLMMSAFNSKAPTIKINALSDQSDIDEQEGFRFLFAGAMSGLRNPRAHGPEKKDTPNHCLDCLRFISFLLRKLEDSGYVIK